MEQSLILEVLADQIGCHDSVAEGTRVVSVCHTFREVWNRLTGEVTSVRWVVVTSAPARVVVVDVVNGRPIHDQDHSHHREDEYPADQMVSVIRPAPMHYPETFKDSKC